VKRPPSWRCAERHTGWVSDFGCTENTFRPDLVFVSRRKVIFVHGCFWHMHGCKLSRVPKSNLDYWIPKFKRNCARDARNIKALTAQGWKHLVIWECESRNINSLQKRLKKFLA